MTQPVLFCQHVSVGYGKDVKLADINLEVSAGEVLAILGANGVGKTTLLKTLLGLLPVLAGSITCVSSKISDAVAYVPQHDRSTFAFSAFDMVLMGRTAHMRWFGVPSSKDRDAAMRAMQRMGIEHLASREYPSLSGGERQLVLIARALAEQKPILLLDEPTASLDYGNQIRVLEILGRLKTQQLAVVMTTHQPEHARFVADRVLLVDPEHGHQTGNPQSLLTLDTLAQLYRLRPEQLSTFWRELK